MSHTAPLPLYFSIAGIPDSRGAGAARTRKAAWTAAAAMLVDGRPENHGHHHGTLTEGKLLGSLFRGIGLQLEHEEK